MAFKELKFSFPVKETLKVKFCGGLKLGLKDFPSKILEAGDFGELKK